jgi:exonuclease VII large subunit
MVEWLKTLAPVVVVLFGFWLNRKMERQKKEYSEELAKLNSSLTKSVQEQLDNSRAQRTEALEHLKRDLQDNLAQRARRVDYLRAQLDKLYGPLAFLLESSARCFETNAHIMKAYDEYFKKFPNLKLENGEDEIGRAIETANRYVALVVKNNKEAINILRTGWGWLDKDDIGDAGQYLADIDRHVVEFEEEGRRLPSLFYSRSAIQNAVEPPSFLRQAFVERVRSKLREKQAELSGLTGSATQGK